MQQQFIADGYSSAMTDYGVRLGDALRIRNVSNRTTPPHANVYGHSALKLGAIHEVLN